MPVSEFLIIAVTIILAGVFTRYLAGLYHLWIDAEQPFWILNTLLIGGLFLATIFLWSFRNDLEVAEVTFARFTITLIQGGAYYLAAYALAGPQPSDIASPREHFWQVRRRFYAVLAIPAAASIVSSFVDTQPSDPKEFSILSIFIAICACGVLFEDERVQGAIAIGGLLFGVFGSYVLFTGELG